MSIKVFLLYKSPLSPLYWPFIKLENNEIGRKYCSNDLLIVSRYLCDLYGNIGLWYDAVWYNIVEFCVCRYILGNESNFFYWKIWRCLFIVNIYKTMEIQSQGAQIVCYDFDMLFTIPCCLNTALLLLLLWLVEMTWIRMTRVSSFLWAIWYSLFWIAALIKP